MTLHKTSFVKLRLHAAAAQGTMSRALALSGIVCLLLAAGAAAATSAGTPPPPTCAAPPFGSGGVDVSAWLTLAG